MESIRGRLTIWYATALIVSIAVFAAVLYVGRRSATYQDLDRRIQSEADLTAGILAESFHARGVLVEKDTAGRPVLTPEVAAVRSEEHTSELQSQSNIVCRLLPEKKKKIIN